MIKKLYICGTEYQLLITLLKTYQNSQIQIMVTFSMAKDRMLKLEKHGYSIDCVDAYDFGINWRRGQFNFLKDNMSHYFSDIKEVYIYMDHAVIGDYLRRKGILYHLIEDGLNYFQYYHEPACGNVYRSRIMKFLYRWTCQPSVGYGFSKLCKSIEVNSLKDLPIDSRRDKFFEVPRKDMFNSISPKLKEVLIDIYGLEKLLVDKNSVLILTQPLAHDRQYRTETESFQTDKEQFDFYKELVEKYQQKGATVYLKVHPRDKVDYSTLTAVRLLPNIPMELLDMMCDTPFKIGVTHSSSAIKMLSCVEEKIILNDWKGV
ncbi:glycosyltransferase family 52 protein [Streptococcus gallolyticus]|nr:glycosyltransferase family 52 protein [Streptococcus gallolyticus]MBY5041989.1 glycosyltransferase family 52 protein [Streptococcus gallolyticus]